MIEKHVYDKIEKQKKYGSGPWVEEPDDVFFEHAGMECRVRRTSRGHLCGYVFIPKNHSLYENGEDNHLFEVHGGITFFNHLFDTGKFAVGFDCAHEGDIVPQEIKTSTEIHRMHCFYRDILYVIHECKVLAEQIQIRESGRLYYLS